MSSCVWPWDRESIVYFAVAIIHTLSILARRMTLAVRIKNLYTLIIL